MVIIIIDGTDLEFAPPPYLPNCFIASRSKVPSKRIVRFNVDSAAALDTNGFGRIDYSVAQSKIALERREV